jgi:signal transduction histidine kinase
MAENSVGWLAPGARRHVAKMLAIVAERADSLDMDFAAALNRRGFTPDTVVQLLLITPAAASRARSLDVFFPIVERSGRELARLRVTPEQATEALHEIGSLLDVALENRFQPAREQLQLATVFALYRGFYAARATEVALLESQARHTEEQERRRIGRELHDEAGQSLLLLRLHLEMLERGAPEPIQQELKQARETVERIVAELRRIVAALSPAVLERLGLGPALRHLAARFEKTCGARVRLRVRGTPAELPTDAQEVIYRVVQESLQNVARHAKATEVNLSLECTDKSVRLRVADNGAGFAVEAVRGRPMSFGLAGMRERAGLLGGTLAVRSAPGKGSTVILRLPAAAKVASNGKNSRTSN